MFIFQYFIYIQVQGFLQRLVGQKEPNEARRGHKIPSDAWYKQLDPGTEKDGRIREARQYYESIILNNIG